MTRYDVQVEVRLRPGIADPEGATIERSLPALGFDGISEPTDDYQATEARQAAALGVMHVEPGSDAHRSAMAKLERAAKAEELARRILALTAAPGFEKELSADQNSAKEFLPSTKP